MKLLTETEYKETFSPPMNDVSKSAEEIIDLWAYADVIIENEYSEYDTWEWKVAHIYETGDGHFQHIGIPVPKDDVYLIVIVNKIQRSIVGHYILKLGK